MLPHHSKIAKYFFIAFILFVLVYAYFEARNVLWGPQISLGTTETITVQEELIEISGTVKNVVEITLSGRAVFIDDTGAFSEKLLLVKGLNLFVFEARDKFDNKTRKVLNVVYLPVRSTQTGKPKEKTQQNLEEAGNIQEPLKVN